MVKKGKKSLRFASYSSETCMGLLAMHDDNCKPSRNYEREKVETKGFLIDTEIVLGTALLQLW